MNKRIIVTMISLGMSLFASSAYADSWHHGHGRGHGGHWRGHHHSGFFFNYSSPAYYPRPVYYYPQTVVVTEPSYEVVEGMPWRSKEVAQEEDRYCREYQSKVRVGGHTQSSYGTACMEPDGSWEIVD